MAVSKNQVEFECEFMEDPPQWLQTECPVCLHILQEPYQVTCCGKSFCRQCIEMVKNTNKPCPCCNEDDFNDFPNKGLQQPLYGFKVYCSNKGKGCHWKGELGQLNNHLNMNPSNIDQFMGCNFAEIKCDYCYIFLTRGELLYHKISLCDKRPFSCKYCNDYTSTYNDVIHNHWPVCACHPVHCPNACGAIPQRQNLECHVAKSCPLTVVECEFHYTGCEVRLPRRNMPDHLKDGLVTHFSLLAVSHKRQQEEIKTLKKEHQEEIKALTKQMNKLKIQTKQLRLHTQIFPVDFMVINPPAYRVHNPWSSAPFYSHSQGYKLRLTFFRGIRSVLVHCYLMQGEFDGLLKWPFKAEMNLVLLHQQAQGVDYESSIELKCNYRLRDGADDVQCGNCAIMDIILDHNNNSLQIKIVGVQF